MADLSGVSSAIHNASAREVTINQFAGGLRRFAVDIPVLGIGEVTTQIWFPHYYTEKPLHNWGMEIVGNADIPVNATPLANVLIRSWTTKEVADSHLIMYQGCRATIRTYSPYAGEDPTITTRFSFSLFFEGVSISMPGKE